MPRDGGAAVRRVPLDEHDYALPLHQASVPRYLQGGFFSLFGPFFSPGRPPFY